LALMGIAILFLLFGGMGDELARMQATSALVGFGFGSATVAIFARVGGGIFRAAADIGANWVVGSEADILEHDPRNPVIVTKNVGDNVGGVAGMSSDLFESYVSAIVAAMLLATFGGLAADNVVSGVAYPLLVASVGILVAIGNTRFVQTEEGATQGDLLGSLRTGVWMASAMMAIAIVVLGFIVDLGFGVIAATLAGLLGGVLIGFSAEYHTSAAYSPIKQLVASAQKGVGVATIRGLSVGMESVLAPVAVVVFVTLVSITTAGFYGVAVAAVGMVSTLGIILATDAYGPVADNAHGIAVMSDLPDSVRERTETLSSLANTTAATARGLASGSAAITVLALMVAFIQASGLTETGAMLTDPETLAKLVTGLLIGGVLPYVFSAQMMSAVTKIASEIAEEARRQCREIPGVTDGTGEPDYKACATICTQSATQEMLLPGLIVIATPILIVALALLGEGNVLGTLVGAETLMGLLLGALISAFMLAVMMVNAGAALSSTRKYAERSEIDDTEAHQAAVIGDNIGKPFRNASGPALNTLLKLLALISLVVAPLLAA